MTPYDMIREHMSSAVPYANHSGVVIESIADGVASARLEQTTETSNHIGSVHAGALFTLGETASGAAMSGALVAQILSLRPVAAEASIRFVKVAKGKITARASVSRPAAELISAIEADGKVAFDVNVDMTNADGVTVAEMIVKWHVSKAR